MLSSKQRRRNRFQQDSRLKIYCDQMKNQLVTTRFNNETWRENQQYRKDFPQYGCIYPSPQPNSSQISPDTVLLILEMNNDTNKIIGIGAVRNRAIIQKHRVYSNPNYNRYSYVGKQRIDRSEMTEEEERIMKVFDILCFTGPRHMKRLQGMKLFPTDMLFGCSQIVDLVDFITKMFKNRTFTNNKI